MIKAIKVSDECLCFFKRALILEMYTNGTPKNKCLEIQASWVSLEPQFGACNGIFAVEKTVAKLSCIYSQKSAPF